MKEPPPPDFESWEAFHEAEAQKIRERGPVPHGGGCKRWWCCGTWWGVDKGRESKATEVRVSQPLDFGKVIADFKARRPEWFKGTDPQVLEPARPRSVANPIAVEATAKDGKAAAAGEDAEVVEDWDSIETLE